MRNKYFLVFILIQIIPLFSQQTNKKFEALTIEQGLPTNSINCVYQDKKGFIWLGSRNGLLRYDGYSFKQYRHSNSNQNTLSSDGVTSVLEDNNGDLWVGTLSGGLNRYNKLKDKFDYFINQPSNGFSIHDNNITSLHKDKAGNIWAGTWGGFSKYDKTKNKFQNYFKYDFSYSKTLLGKVASLLKLKSPVAAITRPGNYVQIKKQFTLQKKTKLLIVGGGEIVSEDYFDYGWIDNTANKIVWTMREGRNFHLGGDVKNRIIIKLIELNSGKYYLNYRSDISHCYNDWNALAPDYPEFWGLRVISLTEEEAKEFNYEINDIKKIPGLNDQTITKIVEDDENIFWIATKDGLTSFNEKEKQFNNFYLPFKKNEKSVINSIEILNKDSLLVATNKGIFIFNKIQKLFYELKLNNLSLNSLIVTDIVSTKENILWVSTDGEGIFEINLNNKVATNYKIDPATSNGLISNKFKSIYIDKAGSVWCVSFEEGINILHTQQAAFLVFKNNPLINSSLNYNIVKFMIEDSMGNIWLATGGGGLTKFVVSQNTFQQIKMPGSPLKINYLFEDSKKNIIACTEKGVFSVNPVNNISSKKFSINSTLTNENISCGAEGDNGIKYFAFRDNIFQCNEKNDSIKFLNLRTDSNSVILDFTITDIAKGTNGDLWLTTLGGLFRVEKNFTKITRYISGNDWASANQYIALKIHSDNKIWICTLHEGLKIFDINTQKFKSLYAKDGLPNKNIFSILFDYDSIVWFGTDAGLAKSDLKTKTISLFTKEDGLPSSYFIINSALKSRKGEFYFGTKHGLIAFYPHNLKVNKVIPGVVVTSLKVFNEEVSLQADISVLNEVELKHSQNFFTIQVASLNFIKSNKNQYTYRLEGFDKEWINNSNRREIVYTNLDAGTYILHIKASNNDGIWNDEGVKLKLVILPPFYKTWWAYLFYVLIIFTVYYFLHRYEIKKVKLKNDLRLHQLEAEKLLETDRIKSNFFANISHELRTPLTLIIEPLRELKEKIKEGGTRHTIELMERNARRLLLLINQLLDIAKIEAGSMKLQVSRKNVIEFLRRIVMSFESTAKLKQVNLVFFSELNDLEILFDADKIEKVMYNLLSNALKFTKEDGRILVSVEKNKDRLYVTVEDTGIGIPSSVLPNIFNRFYQVDNGLNKNSEGTGIGLSLTKELIEMHRGQIEVQSQINEGTKFIFWIYTDDFVYRIDEIIEEDQDYQLLLPEERKQVKEQNKNLFQEDKPIILLVEDNTDMRELITSLLNNNYFVHEATNGKEGIEKAFEIIPDLIISDVMMPEMDGYEFCKKIKTSEITNHIPVILLTAKATLENKLEGLETGADDYLVKPFNRDELLTRIKNLISIRKILNQKLNSIIKTQEKSQIVNEKKLTSMERQFIEKIKSLLEKNYTNSEYDVEEFSNDAGMSQSQLRRKMNAMFDKSPNEFIRSYRLYKAVIKIKEDGASVSEAAFSVGFNSLPYFSKCFQQEFGYLPSEILNKD